MGWLKLGARTAPKAPDIAVYDDLKCTTQHAETILYTPSPETPPTRHYSRANPFIPNTELPFISKEEVVKRRSKQTGGLFIVVDDIVYGCTQFIHEHHGGIQIIKSFAGTECSWQFWRFHGKGEMAEFGKPLRVGRTKGMENKFEEPKRYVGLRRLGDDWD